MNCPKCSSNDIVESSQYDLTLIEPDECRHDFECNRCHHWFQIVYAAVGTMDVPKDEFSVIHTPSGGLMAGGFRSEDIAFGWLKDQHQRGFLTGSIDEYAVEKSEADAEELPTLLDQCGALLSSDELFQRCVAAGADAAAVAGWPDVKRHEYLRTGQWWR